MDLDPGSIQFGSLTHPLVSPEESQLPELETLSLFLAEQVCLILLPLYILG